jgi:hypothetical protein
MTTVGVDEVSGAGLISFLYRSNTESAFFVYGPSPVSHVEYIPYIWNNVEKKGFDSDIVISAGVDDGLYEIVEEFLEARIYGSEAFRMALDTENEGVALALEALDDPVFGSGGDDEAVGDPADRLMVVGVGPNPTAAEDLMEPGVRFDVDRMGGDWAEASLTVLDG